jgi:hypothetical protein
MTKKTTTKKAFTKKLLSKEATNLIYRKINSVAYHLANETSNSPTDTALKKKKYFELQRKVRGLMVSYDSEKKRATQIMDSAKLDTWLKVKSIPSTLLGKAKTTAKPKAKAKRI